MKIGDGGDVDFQVRTNSDDNTLYIEGSTDNVGIGTNTPKAKLDVNGDVKITGDTFTKGNLGVTGNTYVKGNTFIDGTLSAMGNTTITGDLDVDGTSNLDNTDIDGTLVVDGTNISLDSTSTLNIDNSNTTNGITIGTATSAVPISIGHTTSETTINDNLTVTGTLDLDSVAAITPTPTSTEVILVKDTSGVVKSITKAQLTGVTEGLYWEEDGTGTGIKPSGATTNIKLGGGLTAQTINSSGNTHIGGDIFIPQTGKIKNASQTGTNIQFNNAQMLFDCNSVEMMRMGSTSGVVFNVGGVAALDFTIEGDTDQGLFFVDAGADKVAIGTTTVSDALLTVDGDTRISGDTFNKGNLGVTGGTYSNIVSANTQHIASTLGVSGNTYVASDIYTDQIRRFTDNPTTTKINLSSGNVIKLFAGNSSNERMKISSSDTFISGDTTMATSTIHEDLTVNGTVGITGTTRQTGDVYLTSTNSIYLTSNAVSAIRSTEASSGNKLWLGYDNKIQYINLGRSADTVTTTNGPLLLTSTSDFAVGISGSTNINGTLSAMGNTTLSGTLDLNSVAAITPTPTSTEVILVKDTSGIVKSITKAQLTGVTSDYWQGDGSGTGIKPSGTTTNVTVDGNITANGNIVGDNSTNISGINLLGVSTVHGPSDDDTKITFTADDINITAGNVNMLDFTQNDGGQDEITFNEAGADIDVRMEGDTDQNLFFLDAGNDKIAIGTSTVSDALLTVDGDVKISGDTFIKDNLGVTGRTSVSTIVVANNLNISGTTRLIDDQKILLGAGEDTQIYQTGAETIIKDASTGNIKLRAGTVTIQNGAASKTMGVFNGANSVDLNYNGNTKFQTSVNGINVTGWVQASTDVNVSGNTYISGTLSAMGNTTLTGDLAVDGTSNLDNTDIDGTFTMDGTAFDVNATSTLTIDNTNTTNGLKIGTANSAVPISIGHTTSETTVNDNLNVTGDLAVDGTSNLDNTDIDGTLVVDGTNISLDSTTTLNIDNSNTSNGITIGTATSGVPIQLGHSTSVVRINDDMNVTGNTFMSGTLNVVGAINSYADITAYYTSDRRLKDNIQPIEKALDKVNKLGGYEFDWNDKQEVHEGHDIGVIAQEVEEVFPELVVTRNNGYKAVRYEKLVPVLIQSIKELKKEIEELKSK